MKNKKGRFTEIVDYLNNNKLFAGFIMLILNIGSKYATIEFSETQEEYLKLIMSRQLIIFASAWATTHDIILSIIITASFIVLADFITNPASQFCILPIKKLNNVLDTNKDNHISQKEIDNAIKILQNAKKKS